MHVVRRPPPDPAAFSFAVVRVDESRASLTATGDLDLAAVVDLATVLARQETAGRRFIRVNLSAVTFMDCSCLAVLVDVQHRLEEVRGQLVLTNVSDPVTRLLAATDMAKNLLTTREPAPWWDGASA